MPVQHLGADSGLPEFDRLAGTIEAWWPEVLRFPAAGIGNTGSEANNRTVKTAARTAYGVGCGRLAPLGAVRCTRQLRRVTVC